MAIRKSINKTKPATNNQVTSEIMNLLIDMHDDINKKNVGSCEIASKLMNDCWVVGKHSGFRQFYVIFNQNSWTIV